MERIKNLMGVKVGDKFFVYREYSREVDLVTCTKVTPKRCKIGRGEYLKNDASGYGSAMFRRIPSLYLVDAESSAIHMEQVNRRQALETIRKLSEKDTTELLMEVYSIIKRHKESA